MKASVYTKYGPPTVLTVKSLPDPEPGNYDIQVKIHAATVNRSDCAMLTAKPFIMRFGTGLFTPKKQILGTDFAGEVTSVGPQVSRFKVGDKVFGFDDRGLSTHAQVSVLHEDQHLGLMPDGVDYIEAAASLEGMHYAYNFINKVDLKPGDHVIINGATGAIGSACLQLCVHYGAHVTAVCNTKNVELMLSLGARKTIDYEQEDFTRDNDRYDYVFDAVGKSAFGKCRPLLKPGGVYISSELGWMSENIFFSLFTPLIASIPVFRSMKKVKFPLPLNIKRTISLARDLVGKGKFKAVIDRTYPLDEVAEAFSYVLSGSKTGNVVITMQNFEK